MDDAFLRANQKAWDSLVRKRNRFTRPARDQQFADPLQAIDPDRWLEGPVEGKRVLCLAAGGGKHSALLAAAGAAVTVVDLSAEMLRLDREVAAERRLNVRTIQTSMDDLSMLQEAEFDLVLHPVSTCYVPEIEPVYRQVARVLRPGGLYISQHKQPTSLQGDILPVEGHYRITQPYYRKGALPEVAYPGLVREPGTREFLHRWEELLGSLCRCGFVIEDVVEPKHGRADAEPGTFAHRSWFIAPYIRIKARRRGRPQRRIKLE